MNRKSALLLILIFLLNPLVSIACSMYKITKNGITIVGNNEDWLSPNNQFWFEKAEKDTYGVMYMGLLNNFAQGAINEAGLVFDGFANPEIPIENTDGKLNIPIGTAIRNVMQTMSTVEQVSDYLNTINLSSLSSSQIVFVDKSGTYLIVEGDVFIIGEDSEKAFSNFYYSQIASEDDVELENFQNGRSFLNKTQGESSLTYCGEVMKNLSNTDLFSTQYSTIYNLNTLTVRVYLFHDYTQYVDIDLKKELSKENHRTMIADLFPEESIGNKHYQMYNDVENPTRFLETIISTKEYSEEELNNEGFNGIVNMIGYEWMRKENPATAIKVFAYGVSLMPNDANLYDSLGEAYFKNKEWSNSIINYKKSLTLDTSNENAVTMIKKAEENRSKG
ncbi:hypothetical protein [uncultured Dokdonia sp.]|uniref:hypothetical protein n=1 Tax=uncultured Dokdonia sp. TaxID=575653 RepID=UPI002628EB18|nr:hypothetical protein [uncultured Dokdonia sp.]